MQKQLEKMSSSLSSVETIHQSAATVELHEGIAFKNIEKIKKSLDMLSEELGYPDNMKLPTWIEDTVTSSISNMYNCLNNIIHNEDVVYNKKSITHRTFL